LVGMAWLPLVITGTNAARWWGFLAEPYRRQCAVDTVFMRDAA